MRLEFERRRRSRRTTEQPRGHRRADRGTSLVEVAMTIAIMGIIMVPLLSAVMGTIRTSSSTQELSKVETVLANAADRINRAPRKCDYTLYAQAAAQTEGWAAGAAAIVQTHFVPASAPTTQGTWAAGACAGSAPGTLEVQRVVITVKGPTKGVTKTIEVVKSDV